MTQAKVVLQFVTGLRLEPEFYGEITVRVKKGRPVKWNVSRDQNIKERAV